MNKERRHKIRQHHNPNGRPVIISLKNTGEYAPSQWEGETLSGEMVYIRFRWNVLKVWIGEVDDGDLMTLIDQPRFLLKKELEKDDYSYMKEVEMKRHLTNHLNFQTNV